MIFFEAIYWSHFANTILIHMYTRMCEGFILCAHSLKNTFGNITDVRASIYIYRTLTSAMDVQRKRDKYMDESSSIFNLWLLMFAFGLMRFSSHEQRQSYELHSTMWLCCFLYPPHIIYITQKYLMDCCPFMSIHEVFVVSGLERNILHSFSDYIYKVTPTGL